MNKINVLFVCLGNICRSPVAEGVLRHKVLKKNLQDSFYIDSCGTSQYHIGDQPDPRSVENALKNGITLNHKARQFKKSDFRKFDYILALDNSNLNNIKQLDQADAFNEKLFLLKDWYDQDLGGNVPDPYFSGVGGFQEVFDIVDDAMDKFLKELIEKHKLI